MNNIKLMTPMLSHLQTNSLIQLSRILNAWLDNQGLKHWSADDLLSCEDLTDDQEVWLREYRDAWNGVEQGVGSFLHHLGKEVDPDFLWAMEKFQDNEALAEKVPAFRSHKKREGRCPECHAVLAIGSVHTKESCNYMAHRNEEK